MPVDPSVRNWLPLFIDAFTKDSQANVVSFPAQTSCADFAHSLIHTSGLFYGTITDDTIISYKQNATWSYADSFKIALTKGLFLTYFRWKRTTINSETTEECIQYIYKFYTLFTLSEADNKKYRSIFSKEETTNEIIERIIDLRISAPTVLSKTFWEGIKFNLFASLDILYFALWLEGIYDYDKRKEIEKDSISLVQQAANITKDKNAKAIATYLSASAGLEENDEQTNLATLHLERYQTSSVHVRKILYDYAAFACFSDNDMQKAEALFLEDVAQKLSLEENDIEHSSIYIENFLQLEGDKIFYIHYNEGLDRIRQALLDRTQNIIQKNKQKITTEILESKELVELIRKSINEDLSTSEKDKVREQIFDLLKTIPSLAIFMIPGGAFILPIILKILPEEVLMPSSFINKKKEQ